MGAPLLRSVFSGATSSLRRGVILRTQASPFASSSRVGLDFSTPRFADSPSTEPLSPQAQPRAHAQTTTTTTTLLDAPSPTPSPTSASSTEEPKRVPQFNIAASRAPRSSSSSSSSSFTFPTPRSNRAPQTLPSTTRSGVRYAPEEDPFSDSSAVTHTLHVRSTRNNCLLAFTDSVGTVFGTISGGTGKVFKGHNKGTYEAATQAALKMFDRIREYVQDGARVRLRVSYNGLSGQGRDAVSTALHAPEGTDIRALVVRLEDRTRLKIGGSRPGKKRRV
ncbi:hypothetical protein BCR39DRAFT_301404 [Naematelia encephala]|uniref:Ribosomal protein S11-domain-containing protein n=1 Tax=Naematelia encephala TaxID=71784 RepID=A0A1Y2BF41_9TREE|nr:hypothetical protein BCR39DRAFT_301404 [Naematelia encephala]